MPKTLVALALALAAPAARAQAVPAPQQSAPPGPGEAPAPASPAPAAKAPVPRGAVLEEVSGTVTSIDRKAHRLVVESAAGAVTLSLDRNTMVYGESALGTVLDLAPGQRIRAGRNADFLAYWVQIRVAAQPAAPPAGRPSAPQPAGAGPGAAPAPQPTGPAGGPDPSRPSPPGAPAPPAAR